MKSKKQTYEEYLEERFNNIFKGTKDQIEDALDSWLSRLDVQELLDWGTVYGNKQYNAGYSDAVNEIKQLDIHND